jgi:hydroxypyruvate isomerase
MGWSLPYTIHLGYGPPGLRPQFQETVGTGNLADHVRYAAELGVAGVLYPWALQRPPDEVAAVREALADSQLAASCVVCVPFEVLGSPIWTERSAANSARLEEYVRTAAQLASSLNSTMLAVLIAADPRRPDGQAQRDDAAANLRDMAEVAADHGVTIGVEPMVALPGMLLHNTADAVSLITQADHRSVGLIFDTAHVSMMDGEILRPFTDAYEHVILLQFADDPGRVEPGAGNLDIVPVAVEAITRGYRGLVDLEHEWLAPTKEGEQAGLGRIRRFDENVQAALARPQPA